MGKHKSKHWMTVLTAYKFPISDQTPQVYRLDLKIKTSSAYFLQIYVYSYGHYVIIEYALNSYSLISLSKWSLDLSF